MIECFLYEIQKPSILVIGYAPEAVDFSGPAIPPGLDLAAATQGIQTDIARMKDRGWEAEQRPIQAGGRLTRDIEDRRSCDTFDCIIVGAGVRMTTKHISGFEQIIAAVRQCAPNTPIAFRASPDSGAEAAARTLSAR